MNDQTSLNARTSLRSMGASETSKARFVGERSSSFRMQVAHPPNINVAMTKVTDVHWDPEADSHEVLPVSTPE
ncbi:hypothetical protein H0H93_014106 [Arthromyces matolae]|nr:hypothetical protein H0H93_014106 [Arthromyces matolae]